MRTPKYQIRTISGHGRRGFHRRVLPFHPGRHRHPRSYQQPSDKILAQLCGFDHHLGKPFDTRALLKLLAGKEEK